MNSSLLAKIFGWAQFGLQVFGQVATGPLPHGWAGWTAFFGSLASAVAIHHASSTDGSK